MTFVALCLTVAASLVGQSVEGVKVAVLNLPVVSERYQRTHDLEGQFEVVRQRVNQQRSEMREKIDRMGRSLQEELKPGSDAFRSRQREIAVAEAELRWFEDSEGQKVEQGLAQSLQLIYSDIIVIVAEIAKEKNLDIVVASDEIPEAVPDSAAQVRQHILLQKVVYWTPRVDITDAVVARLNASYDAKKAAAGAGSDE
jgi:Skp family chaperone for outer membrane proteins